MDISNGYDVGTAIGNAYLALRPALGEVVTGTVAGTTLATLSRGIGPGHRVQDEIRDEANWRTGAALGLVTLLPGVDITPDVAQSAVDYIGTMAMGGITGAIVLSGAHAALSRTRDFFPTLRSRLGAFYAGSGAAIAAVTQTMSNYISP